MQKFDFFVDNRKFKNTINDIVTAFKMKDFTYNLIEKVYQENALKRTKQILNNTPKKINLDLTDITLKGKKIVFNVINGIYGPGTFASAGLAIALMMRGHDTLVLTCGKALSMCTAGITIYSAKNPCDNCVDYSKKFYTMLGIPHKTYFDYVTRDDLFNIGFDIRYFISNKNKDKPYEIRDIDDEYKGVNIKQLATNSAERYFEGKMEKENYDEIYYKELANAIISVDVAERMYEEEKPDILISSQNYFSAWGGIAEYCRNQGVRIIDYCKGYDNNTIGFDINQINKDRFNEYYNKYRSKQSLSTEETSELNDLFNLRMLGAYGDTKLYKFETKDIKKDLDYEKTYCMFTNIPYDAGLHETVREFKDIYEWVSYTIELFKEKPKNKLLIKIHPIESVVRAQNTISDYIKQNIDLTDNIEVIPSNTDISPYSLFPIIDVGILYSGTLGLELSLKKIPVVLVGASHYSDKGFTFDVYSREQYKQLLSKDIKLTDKQAELAKVYAYYYFIKSYIPVNFFYRNNFLDVGWNIKSFSQLAPGKDKHLDVVCDYIVNGGVYQKWK